MEKATTSGTLILLLAITTFSAASADDLRPLSSTLGPQGIAGPLTALRVAFNRTGAAAFELHGADVPPIINEQSLFLKSKPLVEWSASLAARATLMFVDLGPEKNPSKFFPYVHSLWGHCRARPGAASVTIDDCATAYKPYQPPGNVALIPNRYTFILFRHVPTRVVPGAQLIVMGKAVTGREKKPPRIAGLSFARLLRENVGLEAVAANFVFVKGSGTGARRGGRRMRARG